MSWDPSLLRKYNITSHFRLLNQVRSELREQPIQRPLAGSRPEPTSRRALAGRSSEASGRRRSSGRTAQGATPTAITPTALTSNSVAASVAENSFDPIVLVPVITDAFDAHS
jgi:hypothetical protein